MSPTPTPNTSLLQLGGICGLGAGLFLPAVIIQIPVADWFPEEALGTGTMPAWLDHLYQTTCGFVH